ncbi:leucine-rich repeat and coiled-coil domain-containing protein 1 isoform X2 [Rhinatrema bivittatum]|uniref:leucine-rich repeat and coiled-coil domain-containing protein 1 isoform X2 n=1 Tax=Rhinatrema bivittatum TaxID=194408 RepID=UPI00112BE255|nr:leucine-rich repeat and coiled-coil domain-containing protein 1 isoform X2 [Rhinatrema bivittatum]
MAGGEPACRELSLMDKDISSLLQISLSSHLHTLNLHCNHIAKIEGLGHIQNLHHLDLSSNRITCIEGLNTLIHLRTLNLSCNLLRKVEGLQKLVNLTKLNLSYNRINDLSGFMHLHGTNHRISNIDLYSNCISGLEHLLQCMAGLCCLSYLTLEKNGKKNPVCESPGYREIVLKNLPQLMVLDEKNLLGQPENVLEENSDLSSLESFLKHLETLDPGKTVLDEGKRSAVLPLVTPCIDKVLSQYRQRVIVSTQSSSGVDKMSSSEPESVKREDANSFYRELRIKKLEDQIAQLLHKSSTSSRTCTPPNVLKAKRDLDVVSESDFESGKENHRSATKRTKVPNYRKNIQSSRHRAKQPVKGKVSDSGREQSITRKPKQPSSEKGEELYSSPSSGKADEGMRVSARKLNTAQKSPHRRTEAVTSSTAEESTYRVLVQELDQEREKRWKVEQIVKKLTENIKELQSKTKEEKDINSLAVYTTDRLKELVLKERNAKIQLEGLVHHLKDETERLGNELTQVRSKEEEQQKALKSLEEALSKMDTQRVQQQATEMKRIQDAELKTAAAQREVDLLRISIRQHKEKVQQLQELFASREQAHRKELEARVALYGPEFQEALAKEIAKDEQRHTQHIKEFQEKINTLKQQYSDLEDEFRVALTIEAKRFKEQKEKRSTTLIQELTAMVKEQKAKIAEVTKSKQEMTSDLKSRIRALERVAEEDKHKTVQIELFKQEKSKLISQLTAQESVIDGLKAERKIWGQELAQQGVSLAQDRGKLEAKIEVLITENETLKKQIEHNNDALKIKTKVVDDQTETIRKLKEGLQERDEQIRKHRDENLEIRKVFQEQIDERAARVEELEMKLERHNERKEELKILLEEKTAELEDIKKAYSTMNKKWQDKAGLLTQLEMQVRQMKENFDAKEKKLIEERDRSLQTQKIAVEKLHSVDDAFRRQLESVLAAHQAELLQLANDKQKEIEAANKKVYQVEEEMRQLLQETANSKKAMEEKIRRLTNALSDIQQDL